MHILPTIQNVSPAYVVKALMAEPNGTFIFRARTSNDDIISSIHINNRSTVSTIQQYVVLSVRVDSTLYRSPVMNYRLTYTEQNPKQLLEQYNAERKQLPTLKRELILPVESPNWILDPKQFYGIDFSKNTFGGKSNNGLSEAMWQRPKQDDIKIFIKRFSKTSPYFPNELNLLKQICFFPITTFYGHYSDGDNNCLVFANNGKSLESVSPIRAQGNESKMYRIVKIAFQISNAMMYLEKKNIVHRDLTAGNILIDDYGFIRIADFGHAIQKQDGKNNLSRSLTNTGEDRFQIRFLAPECIPKPSPQSHPKQPSNYDRRQFYASFSSKSDVWAFGILLIQLMLKNPSKPYPHIDKDLDIPQHIKINREMHPKPDDCNIDIYYILQQCWAYEPINRISFTDIRLKMKNLSINFSLN